MDRSELLADILADWHARRERGESLAPDDVVRRHPEYAEELRDRFAAIEKVDDRFGVFATIPKQIGEFRILREIGRGGMGIVYEAEQPSMRRHVALKVLLPSIVASPKAVGRFRREAQAAGALKHTNIVAVHQLGQDGGVWFSAMELVEGRPLSEVIDDLRKAQGAGDAARDSSNLTGSRTGSHGYYIRLAEMFASVAEGLEVAHEHGVVHRDIKPSNLLLDVEGELRIVDFGLARLDDAAAMTITGDVVGTPNYMSPEQVLGTRSLDHRTDVYSLGATLYEALALRPPFVAPNLTALVQRITQDDPSGLRRRVRGIPRDLETIVLKALEKDPARRFASAGEMAQELRRFAQGATIRARPIGPVGRAWRVMKRHKVRSSLVAAVLVATTVGGFAISIARREAAERHGLEYDDLCRQADLAATAEWNVHESAISGVERDERAFGLYSQAIRHSPDRWRAYLGRAMVRTTDVNAGLEDVELAREHGLPERTAHLARAFLFSEGYMSPRFPRDAAHELALADALPEASRFDAYLEGRALHGQRKWAEAERTLTQALADRGDQGPLRFLSLYRRALARERLKDWAGALQDFSAARELVGDDSLESRMRVASYWWRLGQTERATQEFEALIAEAKDASLGDIAWWGFAIAALQSGELDWMDRVSKMALTACPDSPLLLNSRFDVLFDRLRDIEGALAVVEAATEPQRADWVTHNNRGRALAGLWRHDEALTAYADALALSARNPMLHVNRAVSFSSLERDDEAMAAVEAALAVSPDFPPALAHKASILTRRNEVEAALKLSKRAIDLAGPKAVALTRHVHALALRQHGELDAAFAEIGRALEAEPDNIDSNWVRAELLRERGAFEEALAAFDRTIELDPLHKPAHAGRATLLSNDLRRPEAALAAWQALLALPQMKDAPEGNLWIGNLHFQRGQWAAAVESLDKVLASPADQGIDHGLVGSMKAQCLLRLGRVDEALAAGETARRITQDRHPGVLFNVACLLLDVQQFEVALGLLERAISIDPHLSVAQFGKGMALAGLGKADEALLAFDAYIATAELDPAGYFERGQLFVHQLNRPKDAVKDAERVIQLEGGGFRGHVILGDARVALDDFPEALVSYEAALGVDPTNIPVRANRAFCLAKVGRPKAAFAIFETLIFEQPHPIIIMMYARCLATAEDRAFRDAKRAVSLARQSIEQMPDNPDVHNTLGVALCAAAEWAAAIVSLEEAARLRGGGDGYDLMYLALAHANLEQAETARAYLKQATDWIAENEAKDPELLRARAETAQLLD